MTARESRSTLAGALAWVWLAGVYCAPSVRAEDAPVAVSPASAVDDPRDVQARKAFASGDYQRALALYIELFAAYPEEVIYYRNIGRCYQSLGQPERAIASFQNYQRRAALSTEESAEIGRYIDETQRLQQARDNDARLRAAQNAAATKRRRLRRRAAGYTLIAAAPVLASIGLGLGAKARNRQHDLEALCTPETPCEADDPERARLVEEGERAERRQWWLLGAAGASLGAGTLVLLLARKASGKEPALAIDLSYARQGGPVLRLRKSW